MDAASCPGKKRSVTGYWRIKELKLNKTIWYVDINSIDLKNHKRFIIERIIERENLFDFLHLLKY
ncbi:DUF6922 domain-containing protein [Calditrichota bacterium GD2]